MSLRIIQSLMSFGFQLISASHDGQVMGRDTHGRDSNREVCMRSKLRVLGIGSSIDSSDVMVMVVVVVAGTENTPREFQLFVACLACRS